MTSGSFASRSWNNGCPAGTPPDAQHGRRRQSAAMNQLVRRLPGHSLVDQRPHDAFAENQTPPVRGFRSIRCALMTRPLTKPAAWRTVKSAGLHHSPMAASRRRNRVSCSSSPATIPVGTPRNTPCAAISPSACAHCGPKRSALNVPPVAAWITTYTVSAAAQVAVPVATPMLNVRSPGLPRKARTPSPAPRTPRRAGSVRAAPGSPGTPRRAPSAPPRSAPRAAASGSSPRPCQPAPSRASVRGRKVPSLHYS
jgi:hypothetical protein